ncbi:MFS general substrate transporter, partial [Pseudovirgaria hyperparasitica]
MAGLWSQHHGEDASTGDLSLVESRPYTPKSKNEEESDQSSNASSQILVPPPERPTQPHPLSRSLSVGSRVVAAVAVPHNERRGLLAFLTLVPEVTKPTDYTSTTKWSLTALVSIAAAAAPAGSAIIMPALADIAEDFDSNPTVTNLSLALYVLSMSIFPLWWSSFSETLGRRTVYVASFSLFLVWNVLSAVSVNVIMFIVMRTLSGGAASSVQAVGAGTIADIWEPKDRGKAMGLFYLGPLCGPLLAPMIGGALADALGWRSTQWFLVGFGGITLMGILLLLPETLLKRQQTVVRTTKVTDHVSETGDVEPRQDIDPEAVLGPKPLRRASTMQSIQLKTSKWIRVLRRCLVDPLSILLLLRFPAVLVTVYYASIAFGSLYVLNVSIQETFRIPPYGFSDSIIGLLYIPNSLGYLIASLVGGRWVDYIMKREASKAGRYDEKGRPIFQPEDRMRENAWLGAVLFPSALLWYGWAAHNGATWIIPMIANFFFGIGSMLIFQLATTMLTEFLPRQASTGIAVNNFARNIFGFAGSVAAEPAILAIGNGWLFTILAIVGIISGPMCVWSMKKYGTKWRDSMNTAMNAT